MKQILTLIIILFVSFNMNGQKLDDLYKYANSDNSFMSHFSVNENETITDRQLNKWIKQNSNLFANVDSIRVTEYNKWYWGSTKTLISKVSFVKSENIDKRKFYFAEIARKKEEARIAELKRQEELRRQEQERIRIENERLARIKSEIENGTFTGNHFYQYSYGKYIGDFVNGKPDGYGEQYFGNGNWYKGNFKEGYRNGKGTERIKESGDLVGFQISGNYVNGKRDGIFYAFKGTWLTGSNQWELEFDNGNLISNTQTSSEFSDFWKNTSSEYSSANSSGPYKFIVNNGNNSTVEHRDQHFYAAHIDVIDGGTFSSNTNDDCYYSTTLYDKDNKIIKTYKNPFDDNGIGGPKFESWHLPGKIIVTYCPEYSKKPQRVELHIYKGGSYTINLK